MNLHTKTLLAALATTGLIAAGSAHAAAIHHWSFDSNGNDSVGSNDATADGATFGNTGGAFGGFMDDTSNKNSADLASDIVLLASTTTDTDGWAISFWLNNWSFNDIIMGDDSSSKQTNALWTRDTTTNPRFQMFTVPHGENDSVTATGANVDNTDNWTHFVWQREANGNMTFYIDGTAYQDSPVSSQDEDFTLNTLGDGTDETGGNGFIGDLDEVWVFDSALTSDEVVGLRDNNVIPEPSSLALLGLGGLLVARRRRG